MNFLKLIKLKKKKMKRSYCCHCDNLNKNLHNHYYCTTVFRKDQTYKFVNEITDSNTVTQYLSVGYERIAYVSHPYHIYNNGLNIILKAHEIDNNLKDLCEISYKTKEWFETEKHIFTDVEINRTYSSGYEHQHAWLVVKKSSLPIFNDFIQPINVRIRMTRNFLDFKPLPTDNILIINQHLSKCIHITNMNEYLHNNTSSFYIFCNDDTTCISSPHNIKIMLDENNHETHYKLLDN